MCCRAMNIGPNDVMGGDHPEQFIYHFKTYLALTGDKKDPTDPTPGLEALFKSYSVLNQGQINRMLNEQQVCELFWEQY